MKNTQSVVSNLNLGSCIGLLVGPASLFPIYSKLFTQPRKVNPILFSLLCSASSLIPYYYMRKYLFDLHGQRSCDRFATVFMVNLLSIPSFLYFAKKMSVRTKALDEVHEELHEHWHDVEVKRQSWICFVIGVIQEACVLSAFGYLVAFGQWNTGTESDKKIFLK